jgi:hypothetical protein
MFRRPAHAANEGRRDPLGIDERLVGRNTVVEIGLMHAAERSQDGAQARAGAFAGIAVHFPHSIPIGIPCPLVLPMIDRSMWELQPMVPAVLVRIDDRRITWHGFLSDAL